MLAREYILRCGCFLAKANLVAWYVYVSVKLFHDNLILVDTTQKQEIKLGYK